jgi:hypothetical protein
MTANVVTPTSNAIMPCLSNARKHTTIRENFMYKTPIDLPVETALCLLSAAIAVT